MRSLVIVYTALLLFLVCLNCQRCMEEERAALLQIKSSINNPDGTAFSSWYGEDCCQWEGLQCDVTTSRVIRISFHHRRDPSLDIWYPNATLFAQFKDLQELQLPGNHIGGFVSPNALHKLKHLQKLDLRDNSMGDHYQICWGNIPSLNFLDLSRNHLHHIPKCLCESQSLTELILSNNKLRGNINNACLSNMSSLKHLDLSANQFSGSFPSLPISNLTNIESLIISQNQFKGKVLFSIFANLSKLVYLDISYNAHLEVETEFPTWSPSFKLRGLKLGGCNLNKQTGNGIPSFIATQHYLASLDLSYNSLVGSIPPWLFYNVTSELWMRGNNFSGLFPKPCKNMSSQLATLDISDNMLHGPLPDDINLMFPELSHLNASMNSFSGSLPIFGGMKQLQNLDLSGNDLHGGISSSVISNLTSLEYLGLSDNNLQGEALPGNSSLPNLRWLYLNRNYFTGTLPDSLSKCSSLLILSIQQNDLSGGLSIRLPVFPQLRALLLGGNQFQGQIPLQLCQMIHLHILDLSENGLSGDVPTCLNNITSWTEDSFSDTFEFYSWITVDIIISGLKIRIKGGILEYALGIDMSSNRLTGTIPIEITELRRIAILNMSNNLLAGQIPLSFKNMKELEMLDLSHNKLSGALSEELTELSNLSDFNVSFNNLSGTIPNVGQFATFGNDSYMGNPGLCGIPVSKNCDRVVEKSAYFQSNVAATYTLVFWCVIFLLYPY